MTSRTNLASVGIAFKAMCSLITNVGSSLKTSIKIERRNYRAFFKRLALGASTLFVHKTCLSILGCIAYCIHLTGG